MGGLFSRRVPAKAAAPAPAPPPAPPPLTPAEEAQLKLKRVRDGFAKASKRVEAEHESWTALAKAARTRGNAADAVRCMKMRAMKEKSLASMRDRMLELEALVERIASQEQNIAFLRSVEAGNAALRKLLEVPSACYRRGVREPADGHAPPAARLRRPCRPTRRGTSWTMRLTQWPWHGRWTRL